MSNSTALDEVAAQLTERLGERVRLDASTARASWYRVGGPVAIWVDVASVDDLSAVAAAVGGSDLPLTVVGEGSNLLVAEAGYDGVFVHLDRDDAFGEVTFDDGLDDDGLDDDGAAVTAGGAVRMPDLARRCAEAGHGGLSWMAGIPGSVGGAVRMNAGVKAGEVEVRHSLDWAELVDLATGEVARHPNAWFEFGYRRSRVGPNDVVTAARFRTRPAEPADIAAENAVHLKHRRDYQETVRTAGSVWTNPPGLSAWQVVSDAGAQGLRVGTAQVSDKHANFIVADPGGAADDVYALMATVRRMVHQHSGIVLEAETVMIGFPPFEELT